MSKFRSPSRGGNLIHRIEIPGMAPRPGQSGGGRRRDLNNSARRRTLFVPAPPAPPVVAPPPPPMAAYVLPATTAGPTDLEHSRAALQDSQARKQIDVLERRLAKMARLLDQRDVEIVSRSRQDEENGVASVYRDVQGLSAAGEEVKQKKALMSSIFEANLKLREMVTSIVRDAD